MIKLQFLGLFLVGLVTLLACEKDDICVDGDTPLLVIDFYDINDTLNPKATTALRVVGLNQTSTVNTFADRSNLESITIPLKTTEKSTTFDFIINSAQDADGIETGNTDTITFTYVLGDEYVSRACGFIANYKGLSSLVETDTDNWIKGIEIVSDTITLATINTTHVKIFH